jgi:hypothetical protein
VLPATGPVSSGGDQGRDFETFRTYLSASPIAETTFVGLISDKTLAFPCTLQKKEQIERKIQSDLDTIMSSGTTVEGVHYFCSADVSVGARHKLQKWAKETHSVELEIHDGQSISELLSGRDVFWIAERYLSVPSEIYPRSPIDDGGEWYRIQLEEWKERTLPPTNHADFSAIKAAGRHAFSSKELRQDIPFWLHLMETFLGPEINESLRRRAIYEVAWLSLKSMKTLSGQEERLREYFAVIPQLDDPADLEDASAMLNYCVVVGHQGSCGLTADEVNNWRIALIDRVEEKLRGENTTNNYCLLLDVRGYLSLSMDARRPVRPKLEDAFEWWTKLLDKVQAAPLFPLERFVDRLTDFTQFYDEPPGYIEFTQQIDILLSERSGAFVAAEKCLARAHAFYKKNKLLSAINQLHQSKVKWFAAETLHSSLMSMLFISHCYSKLKLQFAAKYYALAAAYMTLRAQDSNLRQLTARALYEAADCDYQQGAWCSFMELVDTYLRVQSAFRSDPGNLEKHQDLQRAVLHIVIAKVITQRVAPELSIYIDEKIKNWGIEGWVEDTLPTIQTDFDSRSDSENWKIIGKQLGGVPFSDVGPLREVSWSELGVKWTVVWENNYPTTVAAEQFIAVLQIFLADLAGVDLCLLKTDVNIDLSVSDNTEMDIKSLPSNKGRKWKISLPSPLVESDAELRQSQENAFGAASAILYENSLIPDEPYYNALRDCFINGLKSKITVVQSYGAVYEVFIPQDSFEQSDRGSKMKPVSLYEVQIFENDELIWPDGPGPGYSREKADRMIRARYSSSLPPIRLTLKKLLADPDFRATVDKLRGEGWLDWHFLNTLNNIVITYRVSRISEASESEEAEIRIGNELMNTEEREDALAVPLTEFTEEKMREVISMTMIHTLRLLGLQCRQLTPDLKAIDHFLRFRYNYWTDDIDHEDFFSDNPESASK